MFLALAMFVLFVMALHQFSMSKRLDKDISELETLLTRIAQLVSQIDPD